MRYEQSGPHIKEANLATVTVEETEAVEITAVDESLLGEPMSAFIAFEDINTETFRNPRENLGNLQEMIANIRENGILDPPKVVAVIPSGDPEDAPEAILCLDGGRRVAAIRELLALVEEHNRRVEQNDWEDADANYPFMVEGEDGEQVLNQEPIDFPVNLDEFGVLMYTVTEFNDQVEQEMIVRASQLNEQRKSMSDFDRYSFVVRLMATGMSQREVGRRLNRKQPWVSGVKKVQDNGSKALMEALQEGKVTLRKAMDIAGHKKREQPGIIEGKKATNTNVKLLSRSAIMADAVEVLQEGSFEDVPEVKAAVARYIRRLTSNGELSLEDVMRAGQDDEVTAAAADELFAMLPESKKKKIGRATEAAGEDEGEDEEDGEEAGEEAAPAKPKAKAKAKPASKAAAKPAAKAAAKPAAKAAPKAAAAGRQAPRRAPRRAPKAK